MQITQVHNITFNTEDSIATASFSSPTQLVMLLSSGNVARYDVGHEAGQHLFSVKSFITYPDGGFDIKAPSTIYTLESIVVLVNDYKLHGFVHYPGKYKSLRLWRQEYHADISRYPVALFKNEAGVPHMIYGQDWNRVQIMNLDTRQIITAAKSLIEAGAEERHTKFYETHTEDNKLAWPQPYNYFFGRLAMSPDNKNFLSAGWAWGSCDALTVYEVADFINNPRITVKNIGGWEHSDRPVCWIDNSTVVVAYSPYEEGDDNATKDSPHELHFISVSDTEPAFEKAVKIAHFNMVAANMHYNKDINALVVFSEAIGIAVLSLEGEVLLHNKDIKPDSYSAELNLFVTINDKTVTAHRVAND